MKKVVLYFGASKEKQASVCAILNDLQLEPVIATDDDLGQTVGALMKLPGYEITKETGNPVSMDLMIFEDATDETIQEFNKFSKLLHCEMKQKAMLTDHNRTWKLCDLLKEIEKEHAYFEYVEKIHSLLTQSQTLIIEEYTKESWKQYEVAFYQAYDSLQKELSLEEIKAVYEQFMTAKENLQRN